MAVYIAPLGHGLGDLIVSLPAVQFLIESGEPTVLVLRSPCQDGFESLIPGLSGAVREVDFDRHKLSAADRYINLREHPLQTDHIWGSAEFEARYPGYKITDILHGICVDFGIQADFKLLKPLPFVHDSRFEGKVVLLAGAGGTFKCWNMESWLEVMRRLGEQSLEVVLVGQPAVSDAVAELRDAGVPWIETPSLQSALNAVSSCRALISVDTGLLHLALQQLTPAVGIWINNPGSLNYLRTVPHCFSLVSPRCHPDCVKEEIGMDWNLVTQWSSWHSYDSWRCHATPSERCMNNVSVDAVLNQFQKALAFNKD